MSCHSTPGNSAATSLACALTNTPADEVARRFHSLKSEGQAVDSPSKEQVLLWLEHQALSVRTDEHLSAWRIQRLLDRIQLARNSIEEDQIPDGSTWHAWQNLRAECDTAHAHAWLTQSVGMAVPLVESTPRDIDNQLSELWNELHTYNERRSLIQIDIRRMEQDTHIFYTQEAIDRRKERLAETEAKIEELLDKTAPLEAEHRRRGGWSRYFRVISSGQGHVHASMNCHTCYPTTIYSWLPDLSGRGQEEAVDDYGSEMCSICFPNVLSHPSYQTRGRIEEERRARLDTERAERDRIKTAKEIKNPDGTPLVINSRWREVIRTAVTAERTLVDYLCELQSWYSPENIEEQAAEASDPQGTKTRLEQTRQAIIEDTHKLIDALAHKKGLPVNEIKEQANRKATAKIRRQTRTR